ncbi:hypothetical protein ACTA71_012476 [Dictyostelium dimigraforme]
MSESEKKKELIFQTRSRVVVIPEYVEEDIEDSEDEDYEPSSEDSEDEEHQDDITTRKRKTKESDNVSNKKRIIDVDAEVVTIESDNENTEIEEKKSVDKIWEEMNKETTTTTTTTTTKTTANTSTESPIEYVKNETTEAIISNNNCNNNIDSNETSTTTTNEDTITESTTSTPPPPPQTITTAATSITAKINKPNLETEIVEFAGERIEVKKTSPPPPKPTTSKSKKGGLNNLLSNLSKPKKINTLEKSKLDWDKFKDQDETEKHIIEQQKKDGYLERKNFLDKVNNGTL